MKNTKIFPESIIAHTTYAIINENRKLSNVLYNSVIVALILAFFSLFFIKVEVGVKANGLIKPLGENKVVTSPQTGRLLLYVKENQTVNIGDTLYRVISDNIYVQLPYLQDRKEELILMISDISKLVRFDRITNLDLKTAVYIQQYFSFISQLNEFIHNEDFAYKSYLRDKQLYEKNVISTSEYEEIESKYKNISLNTETFKKQQIAQWQIDKNKYENELKEIETTISQYKIQEYESIVCSPIDGSIQSIENVSSGMYVHSGQHILTISPDGDLVAECYVLPKDIGLVNESLPCRIQVDAFNYNEWGILKGDVKEIFKDVVISNGEIPYYRVYCNLNNDYLKLNNGYKGYIKKGMTINVRFIVNKRTLFQLLYDKTDNWLNPNLKTDM